MITETKNKPFFWFMSFPYSLFESVLTLNLFVCLFRGVLGKESEFITSANVDLILQRAGHAIGQQSVR